MGWRRGGDKPLPGSTMAQSGDAYMYMHLSAQRVTLANAPWPIHCDLIQLHIRVSPHGVHIVSTTAPQLIQSHKVIVKLQDNKMSPNNPFISGNSLMWNDVFPIVVAPLLMPQCWCSRKTRQKTHNDTYLMAVCVIITILGQDKGQHESYNHFDVPIS